MRKRGLRCLALLTAILITAGLLAACGSENDADSTEMPVLRIGSDIYPPFNYTGSDGKPTGIDVDLAVEAFGRMGFNVEFITIDWELKQELLADGEIDCVWGSFTMDGREDDYNWAGPYMVSHQVAAVLPESDIYSLSDLNGRTVAVQATTKPEELFLDDTGERWPKPNMVLSMQDRELIYPALSKGYVDAVAAHETAIRQYMNDYGVEYRILEEPLLVVGLGAAFDKNDDSGLNILLSQTLEEMRLDGTSEKIIGKYLPDAAEYLEVGGNED